MSRYKKIDNVSDNTDTFFNVNMKVDDNISFNSVFEIKGKTVKHDVNKSLNKYDFYDTLLDEFILEYKRRSSKDSIKKYCSISRLDEKKCKKFIKDKYLYLIKYYIDENYITFDMAIKLAKANLIMALPKKYNKTDFVVDYSDEEEISSLKEKYKKEINKEEIKYIKEEKRSLNFEKERLNKEYEQALLQTAALATKRNKINERIKNIG